MVNGNVHPAGIVRVCLLRSCQVDGNMSKGFESEYPEDVEQLGHTDIEAIRRRGQESRKFL
jgi:hypothetical protein